MKKIIIALFIITMLITFTSKEDKILIPEDAIRFRVIANSDSLEDQNKKLEVKKSVEKEINALMMKATNVSSARNILKSNLQNIENIVKNQNVDFQMNYGQNYFPEKDFKGVTYQSGNYESLVITLGKGIGQNWWCVMFPPLCLLEAEESNVEDINYEFYVKKIIDQYLE